MVQDFIEKGFSEIDINISNELFQQTVESFREFDKNVSIEDKNLTWGNLDQKNRKRLGYKDKSDTFGFDNKCYFHYHREILKNNILQNNVYYQRFLDNMDQIFNQFEGIIIEVFEELENKGILDKSDFFTESGFHKSLLRILNYKPNEECKELARAHTDRGFLTFTLYETDMGLRFCSNDKFINVKYIPGKAKIFPGDYFSEYSQIDINPTIHDVEKNMKNLERSSIVLFCNPL